MSKFKRSLMGRSMSPLAIMVTDGDEGSSDEGVDAAPDADAVAGADADSGQEDKGFPEGTPLSEMTVEQREAYWRHETKKQERIVKETKSEMKSLSDSLDEVRREKLSDQERAIEDAKQEGRAEADVSAHAAHLAAVAVYEFRLRGLSAEEAGDVVEVLDLSKITLDDGSLDSDRLDSLAQRGNVPPPGGSRGRGFGNLPDGPTRTNLSQQSVSERAAELRNKK